MNDLFYSVQKREIHLPNFKTPFKLHCFGDVHRDTLDDAVEWHKFRRDTRSKQDEATYYLGMGDYHDFASTKEKDILDTLHETTLKDFDKTALDKNRKFADEVIYMKGKMIGLLEGNHHWRFSSKELLGTTSTDDLAKRLDTENLGWLSYIHLSFSIGSNYGTRVAIDIVACHGKPSGRTIGASITKIEELRQIFPMADIYLMGDNHQRGAIPASVLFYTNGRMKEDIVQKRQFLCRTGSFKKIYKEKTAEYEMKKLLKPADLGAIEIQIKFDSTRDETRAALIKSNIKVIL